MIIDVLLRVWQLRKNISLTKSIIDCCFVIERHILCRTNILGETLGEVPTGVGISLNLQAIHLTTLGGNQDSTFSTLRAIENDCLCTFQEGDLLNFRRQHVVGRTLYTVNDYERHVGVIVVVQTVVIHTPEVDTCHVIGRQSTNQTQHVFKAALSIVFLRQLFHVYIRDTSEQMVGIHVAVSNMNLLFHHGRISIVSGLGASRQWRYCHHG